jgi:hypothetical protein
MMVVDSDRLWQFIYFRIKLRRFLPESIVIEFDALDFTLGGGILNAKHTIFFMPFYDLRHGASVLAGKCPVHAVLHNVVIFV